MPARPLLGLYVAPTIAMHEGRAWIEGCCACGSLVAVSGATCPDPRVALEACPVCGLSNWHKVNPPVGPFSAKWASCLVQFVRRVAAGNGPLAGEARRELERTQITHRESAVWIGFEEAAGAS